MIDSKHLNQEDRDFVANMRLSLEAEIDSEFKDEMLLELDEGVEYLDACRQVGDSRSAMEIWDEWERKKLESEDLENLV